MQVVYKIAQLLKVPWPFTSSFHTQTALALFSFYCSLILLCLVLQGQRKFLLTLSEPHASFHIYIQVSAVKGDCVVQQAKHGSWTQETTDAYPVLHIIHSWKSLRTVGQNINWQSHCGKQEYNLVILIFSIYQKK